MASVDHRSAAEIEREIEDERSALTRTLDEIHDRMSFEALTGDLVDRIRSNSSDIGRSVVHAARDNPIPLALTALGLTWLFVNQRMSSRSDNSWSRHDDSFASVRSPESNDDPYYRSGSRLASGRYAAGGGDHSPLYDSSGRPMPRDEYRSDTSSGGSLSGDESRWHEADRSDDNSRHYGDTARRYGEETRGRLSRASRAVRRGAKGAYATAAELRDRITHGTEELSGEARKRVLEARTRAYEAQLKAEKYAALGRDRATDFYEQQPLVAGALALAFGAAIGGLLPRTRHEDEAFGAYRDSVFDEAERIYSEERSKLESAARETAREMQGVASDVASDVRSDIERGAKEAGDIARTKFSEAGAEVGSKTDEATGESGSDEAKLRKV